MLRYISRSCFKNRAFTFQITHINRYFSQGNDLEDVYCSFDIYTANRKIEIDEFRKRCMLGSQQKQTYFSMRIPKYRSFYNEKFINGERDENILESICGRVISKRVASSKLVFCDILQDDCLVQVMMSHRTFESSFDIPFRIIRVGDIIRAVGLPGKTKTGELTLFARDLELLSPCFHRLPTKSGLNDANLRLRKRYLEMLVNPDILNRFKTRAKIISSLRKFLDNREFLEVETPILSSFVGGATARPFTTHANTLDAELQMRISPELYLKQLIIGGADRVYEIGKQFRNEGIDATHSPEFTTCEFYQAFANCNDLIGVTQELFSYLAMEVLGSTSIPLVDRLGNTIKLEFSGNYRQISTVDFIKEHYHIDLDSYNRPCDADKLLTVMREMAIPLPPAPYTLSRLQDQIISHFVERECIQPTFVRDLPLSLSPLAARHPIYEHRSDRFELFVNGKELVNAYSELTCSSEQRQRFAQQQIDRDLGDAEAHTMNDSFCHALEYGLPPTAGWGLGIDRLCMIFMQTQNIRDVITFSASKV